MKHLCYICDDPTSPKEYIQTELKKQPVCLQCHSLYQDVSNYLDNLNQQTPPTITNFASFNKRIAKSPNSTILNKYHNHTDHPKNFNKFSMIVINENKTMNLILSKHTTNPDKSYIFYQESFIPIENKIISQALGIKLTNIAQIAQSIIKFSQITGASFQIILNSYNAILNQKP